MISTGEIIVYALNALVILFIFLFPFFKTELGFSLTGNYDKFALPSNVFIALIVCVMIIVSYFFAFYDRFGPILLILIGAPLAYWLSRKVQVWQISRLLKKKNIVDDIGWARELIEHSMARYPSVKNMVEDLPRNIVLRSHRVQEIKYHPRVAAHMRALGKVEYLIQYNKERPRRRRGGGLLRHFGYILQPTAHKSYTLKLVDEF